MVGVMERLSQQMFSQYSHRWPWPSPFFGTPHDAMTSLFYGASGAALVEADLYIALRDEVHLARARAYADLALRYSQLRPKANPGLVFGYGGLAWALARLYEVSGIDLGIENALMEVKEARRTSSTDVSHGAAGRGLVLLRGYRLTQERSLLIAAQVQAEQILSAHVTEGVLERSGVANFGFAHGLAGEAYFIHELSLTTGIKDYGSFVSQATDILSDVAVQFGDGAVWGTNWQDVSPRPFWCHGTSGVGLFFLRYGKAPALLPVLRAAATTPDYGLCHGIASIGEFIAEARSCGMPVDGHYEALTQLLLSRACDDGGPVWRTPAGDALPPYLGYGTFGLLHMLSRSVEETIPHPTLLA
ncbi:MAG: hypothetical protein M0Z66_07290 [Thermaerobacter sp.]|nr:hypothetical protein [Thermaerobacter sp.]